MAVRVLLLTVPRQDFSLVDLTGQFSGAVHVRVGEYRAWLVGILPSQSGPFFQGGGMISDRPAISDPEHHYLVCYNISGQTLAQGSAVCWATGTNSNTNKVTLPAAGTLSLFAGVVADEGGLADQTWGVILTKGECSYALVMNHVAQAITAGDILIPVAGMPYLARSGAGDGIRGLAVAQENIAIAAIPSAAEHQVLLRAW